MSVSKRVRDGKVRWVGRYRDPAGKQWTKTEDTKKAAETWANENQRAVNRGEWIDPTLARTTVLDVTLAWRDATTRPGTRANRDYLAQQIGHLGGYPVGKLTATHIRAWILELESGRSWAGGKPLARSTVHTLCAQLSGALHMAAEQTLILKTPKVPRPPAAPRSIPRSELITLEEVNALAQLAHDGTPAKSYKRGKKVVRVGGVQPSPQLSRMILVGAGTGMRPGEVAGLLPRRVEFLLRDIEVLEQAGLLSTDPLRPVKTPKSLRTIPTDDSVLALLAEEIRLHPGGPDEPIFRAAHGGNWTAAVIANIFRRLRDHLNLPQTVTFKALRHFYASTLIANGVSVVACAEYLGHSTPAITLDVYSHLWPGDGDRARAAVGGLGLTVSAQRVPRAVG